MAIDTDKNLSSDEKIRQLVLARLRLLSSDILISIGSEGSFNRDELIKRVEAGDKVGQIMTEMEMEWLQSLKEGVVNRR